MCLIGAGYIAGLYFYPNERSDRPLDSSETIVLEPGCFDTQFISPAEYRQRYRDELRGSRNPGLDQRLRKIIERRDLQLTESDFPRYSQAKVKLGANLYSDKILSGNLDISCSMCHSTLLGTSDGLSLSIGTGAFGDTTERYLRKGQEFVSRNALDLMNRGADPWEAFFWDKRLRETDTGVPEIVSGLEFPEETNGLLSAQALGNVLIRNEVTGHPDDRDVFGRRNIFATFEDSGPERVWSTLMDRLLRYDAYRDMLREAFPDTPLEELEFVHAANALAAYQSEAFQFLDSPWDQYIRGEERALSTRAKRGALVFYGEGKCAECHSGKLFTDQQAHNIAVPQLGPGVKENSPYDFGVFNVTGDTADRFAFRTPPLRGTSVTGPWMHNGAYKSLEGAVRHHLKPQQALEEYNPKQLGRDIQRYHRSPNWEVQLQQFPVIPPGSRLLESVHDSPSDLKFILQTLDPFYRSNSIDLTEEQVNNLIYFLTSLTSPKFFQPEYRDAPGPDVCLTQEERLLRARRTPYLQNTQPRSVPSGLLFKPDPETPYEIKVE